MSIILFAIPAFFILIAVELWIDHHRKTGHYRINDAIGSLQAGVLSRLMVVAYQAIPFSVYVVLYQNAALWSWPVDALGWITAFIVYDFFYYWKHRMGHEMSILWAAHVVHHSSEDYNLTTALRQTSGSILDWIFFIPLAFMGVPPEMLISVAALNLVYQFWVHTQHIDRLGWLEWVFVTPSNHRVHHAQNRQYIDKNYGGVFILWDRLFGTFRDEDKSDLPVYGIRGALGSFNPLMANFQVYRQLCQDSWHTKRWADKFRVWFGRTGWRPEDVSERFPIVKTDLAAFKKYDPQTSLKSRLYALLHHVVVLALTLYLLLNIASLSGLQQVAIVGAVTLSMVCTSTLLSVINHRWWMEALRVVGLVGVMVYLPIGTMVVASGVLFVLASLVLLLPTAVNTGEPIEPNLER